MNLKQVFKKSPMEHWNPLHMGNYGVNQDARDSPVVLSKAKLLRVFLECFPSFKTLDGTKRMQEFELITKHFNIVHWKVSGDSNNGKYFNPNYPHPISRSYMIIQFDNVKLRGTSVQNFGTIYCILTKGSDSSCVPRLRFENLELNHFGYVNPDRAKTKPDLWWRDARHPHITNTEPCLGAFDNMMYKSAAQGNVLQYFTLIKSFLFTWNRHSAYFNMNRFKPLKDLNNKIILSGVQMDKLGHMVGSTTEFEEFREILPMLAEKCKTETDLIFILKVCFSTLYLCNRAMQCFNSRGRATYGTFDAVNGEKSITFEGAAKYMALAKRMDLLCNRGWEEYGYRIAELDSDITMYHESHSDIKRSTRKDGRQTMQWVLGKMKRYRNAFASFLYPEPSRYPHHKDNYHPATRFRIAFFKMLTETDGYLLHTIITEVRKRYHERNDGYLVDACKFEIMTRLWETIFPRSVEEWDEMFQGYNKDKAEGDNPLGPDAYNIEWIESAMSACKIACGENKVASLTHYIKEIQGDIDTFKNDKQQDTVLSGRVSF